MKRNIIILALIALIFSGCRKDADYHPYIGETDKLAYDSYSTQFEYLWKSLSSGYVFWDVDETDWDAVYEEYMPKFHALDAQHEAGQEVTLDDLNELYTGAMERTGTSGSGLSKKCLLFCFSEYFSYAVIGA